VYRDSSYNTEPSKQISTDVNDHIDWSKQVSTFVRQQGDSAEYVLPIRDFYLRSDGDDSSKQVSTYKYVQPYENKQFSTLPYNNNDYSTFFNKPDAKSCHDYYTRQKKIINDLGIKRKQIHTDVFQCSKNLISLSQQIHDKYTKDINILEEQKRKLEEQYEKRQKIIDTFTYPDNQKIIFVLTIIIDLVLIVLNVLLYKNHYNKNVFNQSEH
jgi:hypothetical protein